MEGRPVKATLARRKDEVVDRFLGLLGKELHVDRSLLGMQRRLIVLVGRNAHLAGDRSSCFGPGNPPLSPVKLLTGRPSGHTLEVPVVVVSVQ